MSYQEFAPPPSWSGSIECVWTSSHSAHDTKTHTVLPDGAMDIIAQISDDGDVQNAFVVGAMTKPLATSLSASIVLGIRFFPGVGGGAVRAQASQLTDDTVPLFDVIGSSVKVRDALRSLALNPAKGAPLARVSQALKMEARSASSLVRAATHAIAQAPQDARISAISKELGASRQHLARQFAIHVGLTPKQFARICRVRALLHQSRLCRAGWTKLAAEFGYSDQSHLIADVRSVTGLTPGQWLSEAGSIFPISPVPTVRD